MPFEMFTSDKIDFKINERRQYERIKKNMLDVLNRKKIRYVCIVDYTIKNKQYDLIIIKNDAIISIDLKGYKGEIYGSEEGEWFVKTENNDKIPIKQDSNPFIQARKQRYKLLDFLNEMLPSISRKFEDTKIYNVTAMICFEEGSTYDIGQLDYKSYPWFIVTDEKHLIDNIENTTSNQFYLKDIQINALIKKMKLHKLEIEEKKEKLDIENKAHLNAEDIEKITQRLYDDFGKEAFTFQNISDIIDPEVAARYLTDAIGKNILVEDELTHSFSLSENWSDNVPEIEPDEDVCSSSDLKKYSEDDFWLRPDKSEEEKEYLGVYRGTKYHFNYRGDIWWKEGKGTPKIKVKCNDSVLIDNLLKIKPQGGSFRITEAGEVLTKIFTDENGYVSIYVGKLNDTIELDQFKWKPKELKRGDLWPSIYDGSTFSVNTNKDLLIHIGENKVYALEGHEKLAKKVLEFNGSYGGGRFKINENGNILVLMYHAPYPKRIKNQLKKLSTEEKNLIDIRKRTNRDERVPVYVGNFKGNIKFKKIFDFHREWTQQEENDFLNRLGG